MLADTHPRRAVKHYTTFVRLLYEYGLHVTEPTDKQYEMMDQIMRQAVSVPVKIKSKRAFGRAHHIMGLVESRVRRRMMVKAPLERLRECSSTELNSKTAQERWLAQREIEDLEEWHSGENLVDPASAVLTRWQKQERRIR